MKQELWNNDFQKDSSASISISMDGPVVDEVK